MSTDAQRPPIPETRTWPVTVGSFLGNYVVRGKSTAALRNPATLTFQGDGSSANLTAKFDPPGSAFYALLATIISGFVFAAMLAALGFAAAPGWLLWYIFIVLARRREVCADILDAEAIVVDPRTHRLAFETTVDANKCWVACEVRHNFHEIHARLKAIASPNVEVGQITRPSILPLIILLVLILAILTFIVIFIAKAGP